MEVVRRALRWLVVPPAPGDGPGHLWPRWIVLRLLGLWFASVFYSLWFQVCGLVGPAGIQPAGEYLDAVTKDTPGLSRFWEVPSIFWLGSSNSELLTVCAIGMLGAVMLLVNVAPRLGVAMCTLSFLSLMSVLQRFASYQSDGMLMEAGFISCFFAPPGLRPGLGARTPPSRLALFALQWLWFRIYFESGVAKIHGHDPQWRDFTAMDRYYENGPLPTWISWYVQQRLPHAFHAATAFMTLAMELVLVWAAFFPRLFRLGLFALATPFQLGIILTANYAFLNYLVLSLGVLLLDDRFLARFGLQVPAGEVTTSRAWVMAEGVALSWQVYATVVLMLADTVQILPGADVLASAVDQLPRWPVEVLEPSRLANGYHLFGSMTRARHEIEFEATVDGRTWATYRFRYKPQDPAEAPGVYAPYQPRFEWNLWFASLGSWRRNGWVIACEERLMEGSPDVLALFRDDPLHGQRPAQVRAIERRYWFSSPEQKRATGEWWQREPPEPYGPALQRSPDGQVVAATGE